MFQRIREGLSGPDGAPTFLVLTGDLGVDPCDIAQPAQVQTRSIKLVVRKAGAGPSGPSETPAYSTVRAKVM